MIVNMTEHAYDRMKERFRFNKNAAERMAQTALSEGINHSDTKGRLFKYISAKTLMHQHKGSVIKIYGELVYCFAKEKDESYTLITVYLIPNNLKNQALGAQKKRKSGNNIGEIG